MIEYGFEENRDFVVEDIFVPNSNGGKQTQKDYAITLDMAKEAYEKTMRDADRLIFLVNVLNDRKNYD